MTCFNSKLKSENGTIGFKLFQNTNNLVLIDAADTLISNIDVLVQNSFFNSEKVRTAKLSPAFQFITQVHKQLQNGATKKGQRIADLLENALPPGLEPGTL